jgi:hypothetical protein
MILVRATRLTPHALELADALASASQEAVAFVLDGRHPLTVRTARPKVLVTEASCRALGLFCPHNFPWRCGDYGLYLARARFPGERHFWLLEDDMRLAGGPAADFFRFFEPHAGVDLLACRYARATADWGWYPYARARDVTPHRCLFGIVRLSARALDVLLEIRRSHSRRWARRKRWPNDEGFVATSLSQGGFCCRDINDFGRVFYDDESLSLTAPIRGESFSPRRGGVKIYHPVLFGEDFERGNVTAAYDKRPPGRWNRLRDVITTRGFGFLLARHRWNAQWP